MGFLKRCLAGLALALVFLAAFLAAVDNSERVALNFSGYATGDWPVSWWMLGAFLLGAACAGLLNLGANARLRLKARSAARQAEARAEELDRLRAQPPAPASAVPLLEHR